MQNNIHSDLAAELRQIHNLGDTDGVYDSTESCDGIPVHRTEIRSPQAARKLGKPVGTYVAVDFKGAFSDDEIYLKAIQTISRELSRFIGPDLQTCGLVVGLGNFALTSDSVGPKTIDGTIVTRHIKRHLPELFSSMPLRDVSAIKPGVLGRTGIESSDIIHAVVKKTSPGFVIAIDSLAARSPEKLCSVVQMSDSGICPGSGIGNKRAEISRRTLGVPVFAVGVPTVVSAATLSADAVTNLVDSLSLTSPESYKNLSAAINSINGGDLYSVFADSAAGNMTVTPGDIDALSAKVARLLSTALNKALHGDLSQEQINALLNN